MCRCRTTPPLLCLALTSLPLAVPPTTAQDGRDRAVLQVAHPLPNDIFRAGDVVEIHGTVQGTDFENYVVEWGYGQNPTVWLTTGVELVNDGMLPVFDGTLAYWDTASITEATFTTVRVTANFTSGPIVRSLQIYLDPTLHEGWPVKLYNSNLSQIGHFEPTAADLNNDGYEEIIVYMAGPIPTLYAYDHAGNALPNYPIEVDPNSGDDLWVPFPIVADMNNDGYSEIVIYRPKNGTGGCDDPPCVLVYNYAGELLSSLPVAYPGFSPGYCRDFSSGRQKLALADLDADGHLEIAIVGEWAVTLLDDEGNTFDGWPKHIYGWIAGSHEGSPSFGNLDSDDDLEIVFAEDWADPPNEPGVDRGRVYAYNLDGSDVPGWPVTTRGYSFSSPSIGDIDNDGQEEIVVGFMYWPDDASQNGIYVYDRNGEVLAGWPQLKGREVWSNPVLADFDGDDQLEIVVSPIGSWSGSTYMFRSDGSVVEGWPQSMCWNDWYSPVIGDVSGDGIPDVITNTNYLDGTCSIYAWDFQGGLIEGFPQITGASAAAPVVIADIDNDGLVELIATSNVRDWGEGWVNQGCIYVWDLDAPYDPSTMHWPVFQHDLQRTGRYAPPPECLGDLDGDGDVALADLAQLLSNYGTTGGASYEDGDLDGDGDVDLADLAALLANYGLVCW
ncbi:MAG: FG-GAP repeat domain-containing protein [Phycisphaerae bacterium]